MTKIAGTVAFVTGAGSGIGRAVALELARRGADVAVADIRGDTVAATAAAIEALGRKASAHTLDVADRLAQREVAQAVVNTHGRVQIVVNNAGVGVGGNFTDNSPEDLQWLIGINLWGVIWGCYEFIPHLRAAGGGHLVNVSSLAGLVGAPGLVSYCTSKFGVLGLSEALRSELAPEGIRVTSIHPGLIATNIMRDSRYVSADFIDIQAPLQEFFRNRGMPPEKAAARIADAVERNETRVLVGADARLMGGLKRVFPDVADRLYARFDRWMRGRLRQG